MPAGKLFSKVNIIIHALAPRRLISVENTVLISLFKYLIQALGKGNKT